MHEHRPAAQSFRTLVLGFSLLWLWDCTCWAAQTLLQPTGEYGENLRSSFSGAGRDESRAEWTQCEAASFHWALKSWPPTPSLLNSFQFVLVWISCYHYVLSIYIIIHKARLCKLLATGQPVSDQSHGKEVFGAAPLLLVTRVSLPEGLWSLIWFPHF